jgi:hypothetical protein
MFVGRYSWIILLFLFLFLFLLRFIFRLLFVFCLSNVSIDEGMFGFSIGASTIGLGELTESNRPVCDDALTYNVCACASSDAHSSLLYAIIIGRKYSIRSGTNNYS